MRKSIPLLLVLTLCLFLSGCAEKAVPESQLKDDLYNSDTFSEYSGDRDLRITSFEIVKRKTDTAEKTDTVWVSANVTDDDIKGKMYYVMTYTLYNDGWQLSSVGKDESDLWNFAPLSGVSDEMVANTIPQGAEITSTTLDLTNGKEFVRYTYVESYTYCDVIHDETQIFVFEADNCGGQWRRSDAITDLCYENWKENILGTWKVTYNWYSTAFTATLTIDSIDTYHNPHPYHGDNNLELNGTINFTEKRGGFRPQNRDDTFDISIGGMEVVEGSTGTIYYSSSRRLGDYMSIEYKYCGLGGDKVCISYDEPPYCIWGNAHKAELSKA